MLIIYAAERTISMNKHTDEHDEQDDICKEELDAQNINSFKEAIQVTHYDAELFQAELEIYRENILKALLDLIYNEIKRLPRTQAEVMIQYFTLGHTIVDISKELKVSFQAIDYRKKRAIATLRRRLLTNPYALQLFKDYENADPPISILARIAEFLEK